MMSFNKEEYSNLTSGEIEQMAKELNEKVKNLQKIVYERDNRLTKALNNFDLDGLKKAMAENGDRPFPEDTGVTILFSGMKAKDIDFFLYVTSLPQFKKFDKLNYHTDITKTEEAIAVSVRDKELFDFFINHPKYSAYCHKILPDYGVDKQADKDVIAELFKRRILEPTDKLFTKVIDSKAYVFLEYFIENNSYKDMKNKLHDVYFKIWNQPNEPVVKLVKEKIPNFKDIPLSALVKTFPVHRNSIEANLERYETLLGHKPESYLKIMEEHPMTKDDIRNIVLAFSKTDDGPHYPDFHNFCKFIAEKKPQHINEIKNSLSKHLCKNQNFLNELDKAVLHMELTVNLKSNISHPEPKKLKV
jgi:hypothetical protein